METCIGCGIVTKAEGGHPFVGVGREDLNTGAGPMTAHPVCGACAEDPGHRSLGPLKVSYFPKGDSPVAVAAAKRTDAQSKAGGPINIG